MIGHILSKGAERCSLACFDCAGVSALPDGSIIVTGGDSDNRTSIYNPVTNSWTKGAGLNIPRGYQVRLLLICLHGMLPLSALLCPHTLSNVHGFGSPYELLLS